LNGSWQSGCVVFQRLQSLNQYRLAKSGRDWGVAFGPIIVATETIRLNLESLYQMFLFFPNLCENKARTNTVIAARLRL